MIAAQPSPPTSFASSFPISASTRRPLPAPTRSGRLSIIFDPSCHSPFVFILLPALKLSCLSFSYPRPLFSIVCGLFCENTGGGIPLPALHGSHLTSHKSRLSPIFTGHKSPVTSHASVSPLDSALTRTARFCTILVQISPLESALTETPSVTPLESALTKSPGGWWGPYSRSIRLCVLCAGPCPDPVGVADQLFHLVWGPLPAI